MEVILKYIRIFCENFHNCFCKSFHISLPNLWVLALKLLKNFETLSQLGEHINNWVRKVCMLSILLKLLWEKNGYWCIKSNFHKSYIINFYGFPPENYLHCLFYLWRMHSSRTLSLHHHSHLTIASQMVQTT